MHGVFRFFIVIGLVILAGSAGATTVQGMVRGEAGEGLPGVTVRLSEIRGTVTDQSGLYTLTDVPPGSYTLEAAAVNYQSQRVAITVTDTDVLQINLTLAEKSSQLAEVVVRGVSEAQEVARQPISISSLDARTLRAQAVGMAEVLKRSTGVLVRRSGGLGSDAQVNLNGLVGRAVRIYYDGMPLEYLGGGLEINNLPVNLIDRIDVYKGVMPVGVGTDALGGGVNIVPRQTYHRYAEAAYELGSFNTHRLSAMGLHVFESGLFLGVNAFFNYSDNDYRMRDVPNRQLEVFENRFGRTDTLVVEERINARRFHNRHRSGYLEVQGGVAQTPWAQRLTLTTTYSYRDDEIQHGPRLTVRPGGEATRSRRSLIQRLKYAHTVLGGVDLDYHGIVSLTEETVNDSTARIYDWYGRVLPIANQRGAEILSRPSGRVGTTLGTTHRLTATYALHDHLRWSASNFYGYSRIKGNDPYGLRLTLGDERIDPNTVPSTFQKNIFGSELAFTGLENTLSSVLFYKHYAYRAASIDITQERADRLPTRLNSHTDHGYGLALKYGPSQQFFVRTSYERTLRIPDETEIYGNFLFIRPNYTLRPERSHNLNLGLFAQRDWGKTCFVSADLNGFLRNQQDLIRLEVLGGGETARYINERRARSVGAELSVRTQPWKALRASVNFTAQRVSLRGSTQLPDASFEGVQVPNIPDIFFNTSVQYDLTELARPDDALRVFWNYFYVNQFSVTYVVDERRANPNNLVPTQHQHDLGVSYSPTPRGLQLTVQVNNLLDAAVFDNFRIPKPGRNFSVKLNYTI